MKIFKKLAIIILMTAVLITISTKVEASTGTINAETVNLRKKPSSSEDSTILDQLDKGDEVEILEQEDGWYKVKVKTEQGTITGYINEKLVDVEKDTTTTVNDESTVETTANDVNQQEEPQKPEQTQAQESVINTEISNDIEENKQYALEQETSIKALPQMNSIEKAKISGNIEVIEIINDWCRIENDVESGWIRINNLKKTLVKTEIPTQEPVETTPEETTSEETTANQSEEKEEPDATTPTSTTVNKVGYVNAEGLIVRDEPSTSGKELDSLSRNDKVEIIGQTGKWYKINLDGEIGYVSAKYISDTKVAETTSRSGSSLNNSIQETKQETEQEPAQETEETKQETPKAEEVPEASTPSTSGTTGEAVVEYAKQYLGYKYVSGGASPSTGFDCSGFTLYVYKHFGITLNRSSKEQIKNGVAVEKENLQLGDIVLFNNEANTAIGHVGIYVGDGNFIHASNPSDGVKITTLLTGYYQKRYVGARRVI